MSGKRKEREGESEIKTEDSKDVAKHGSTLFISNIPFQATSTDLQTLFSDIAPVRTAFVVLDKETKISKGVGYVGFAMKEDAERAMSILNGEVAGEKLQITGRALRGEWAGKNKTSGEGDGEQPRKKPRHQTSSATPPAAHHPDAIRSVVISNLPPDINTNQLWKKIRKYDGAESVKWPVGENSKIAHAIFKTPTEASNAASKLHAHVYKGSLLSVALKKRYDGQLSSKKGKGPTPSGNSRLIVRNLPWNVTEQSLHKLFAPHGFVHSVTIPASTPALASDASPTKARSKGFAFVWFLSRKEAEKAIEAMNGTLVGGDIKSEVTPEDEDGKEGRVIAVDWALSKERWEAEKVKVDEDAEVLPSEPASDGESASEAEGEGKDASSASHSEAEEDEDEEASSQENDPDEEEVPSRPTLPTPADGTTLFVRNVPYDATEDDLRTLFKPHGPLRYARLTMDNSTTPPRPRGTGFVCFWNKDDAERVLQIAENVRGMSIGTLKANPMAKNPFSMPSLLTPDPSSSLAQGLVLNGRTLDVVKAVERGEAGKLEEDGVKRRRKEDKRNTYLLREGVIFPNSTAAHTISAADLDVRMASYNSRRQLLNSNPSLYVSKTRLAVRGLPKWVSEKVLKKLAIHSIRTFEVDVKEGRREGLESDELEEADDVPADEIPGAKGKKKRKEGPVIQSKVIRDATRVDPLTASGKSKGYAFLELAKHADALRVLRWCNNNVNDDVEGLMRGWWKAELERNLEAQSKEKKGTEDTGTGGEAGKERVKLMRHKLKELEEAPQPHSTTTDSKKKRLAVEFSVENIQVVKRRAEKIAGVREERRQPVKRKSMFDGSTRPSHDSRRDTPKYKAGAKVERDTDAGPRPEPTSKAKLEVDKERRKMSQAAVSAKAKVGRSMGSLIGRKRKERRTRAGGS